MHKSKKINKFIVLTIIIFSSFFVTGLSNAKNWATILMYHRFGENKYPSTNIRLEQLDSHISELIKSNFHVLPVKQIINAIQEKRPLPNKTIGITIDDGYLSIYNEAWPRFKKAGFPFTIFISTSAIDSGRPNYLNWNQIRELQSYGVEIGGHTSSHNHMPASSNTQNDAEIQKSTLRMITETGISPEIFAYPFGEASVQIQKQVRQAGYKMAFGQHSGVVNSSTDFYYIPRFAMNEKYGSVERFRLVINALPLPVKEITPRDPLITGKNPPNFGFTVHPNIRKRDQLSCFTSNEGRVKIERLGSRIEVRMTKPFQLGRTRINCTLPESPGQWRWLGRLFLDLK